MSNQWNYCEFQGAYCIHTDDEIIGYIHREDIARRIVDLVNNASKTEADNA